MSTHRTTLRTALVAASLLIAGGVGYGVTASAHADRSQSQDPRTWFDASGDVKEGNVPNRIAMSTADFAGGQVFVDPHFFYGELGASADQGPVPVYATREGGDPVGVFDITTGNIVISTDNQRAETPAARTLTTVAAAEPVANGVGKASATTASANADDNSDTTEEDANP